MAGFRETYDLMSTRRMFATSVVFVVLVTVAFLAMSCLEPEIDVSCQRTQKVTCTLREYSWISSTGPATVDLETTTFEVDNRTKTQKLWVRHADGSTAFPSDVSNANARAVKRQVDAFRANPSMKSLSVHEEFPSWIFLVLMTVLFPLTLLPSWLLGGRLIVEANPGRITVTRVRPFWKRDVTFTFASDEKPLVEAQLLSFNRKKRQGSLVVKASTGATTLVKNSVYEPLTIVAGDLNRHFQNSA